MADRERTAGLPAGVDRSRAGGSGPVTDRDQAGGPRAAVLGSPVEHSLSPVLHTAGYAAAGLSGWRYTAVECAEDGLPALVAGLGPDWRGLSLTMPLKQVGLRVADRVEPLAATLGAVNTLVREDSGWSASNTDVPGMVDALRAVGADRVAEVAVLGAGGTARAALGAAAALGASSVRVYARRRAQVDELRPLAEALGLTLAAAEFSTADRCAAADVVISTLPRGVADHLAVRWRSGVVLLDVLYHPWPTVLAGRAAAAGVPVASGLDLLLAQGVRQFTLFTGVAAPLPQMRAALVAAANSR